MHPIYHQVKAEVMQEGCFFGKGLPTDRKYVKPNGNIVITCTIHKLVAASVTEADSGALFVK